MTVQLTGATIFLDDDAEQRRVAFTTCVTLGRNVVLPRGPGCVAPSVAALS